MLERVSWCFEFWQHLTRQLKGISLGQQRTIDVALRRSKEFGFVQRPIMEIIGKFTNGKNQVVHTSRSERSGQ